MEFVLSQVQIRTRLIIKLQLCSLNLLISLKQRKAFQIQLGSTIAQSTYVSGSVQGYRNRYNLIDCGCKKELLCAFKNMMCQNQFSKKLYLLLGLSLIIPVSIALGGVDLKILWNVCLMFKSSKASFTRHSCSKKIE